MLYKNTIITMEIQWKSKDFVFSNTDYIKDRNLKSRFLRDLPCGSNIVWRATHALKHWPKWNSIFQVIRMGSKIPQAIGSTIPHVMGSVILHAMASMIPYAKHIGFQMLPTLIQRYVKKNHFIFEPVQKRETNWNFIGCLMPHFMIVLILCVNLLNLSWMKMSVCFFCFVFFLFFFLLLFFFFFFCFFFFVFRNMEPLTIPLNYHYKNTPIQIWRKFHLQKLKIFRKKIRYFSYFCSKHRLWVLVRTASARRF